MLRHALAPKALSLFLATTFATGMIGCTSDKSNTQATLSPSINPPIADVPIPTNFHLAQSESSSKYYPMNGLREVDHVYHGSDPELAVVRFYRETMPTNGWTHTLQRESADAITEFFTKNNEQCIVQISQTVLHTTIRVQIFPAGSAVPPKS